MKPPVEAPRIDAALAAWVDAERVERARELHAAARDIRMVLGAEHDRGVVGEQRARLVDARFADVDLAREHERLRASACRHEAARDEELIGPDLHVSMSLADLRPGHGTTTSGWMARASAARPSPMRGPGRSTLSSMTGTTWPSTTARTCPQPGVSLLIRSLP